MLDFGEARRWAVCLLVGPDRVGATANSSRVESDVNQIAKEREGESLEGIRDKEMPLATKVLLLAPEANVLEEPFFPFELRPTPAHILLANEATQINFLPPPNCVRASCVGTRTYARKWSTLTYIKGFRAGGGETTCTFLSPNQE